MKNVINAVNVACVTDVIMRENSLILNIQLNDSKYTIQIYT